MILRVVDLEPSLIEKEGLTVHHGLEVADVDLLDFIRREREGRSVMNLP